MKLIHGGARNARHFWGEVAPTDHVVQIYESEDAFIESLESFVAEGLECGDGVVAIATAAHRDALHERLQSHREFDLHALQSSSRLIVLDAQDTLDRFMVDGWPDESLFNATIAKLLEQAGAGRRVRAFGEMVALLWAQGHCGATVRLEHFWHRLCAREGLSLLCAYPRSGFTDNVAASIRQICDAHSHVVEGHRLVSRAAKSMSELTQNLNAPT